MNIKLSYNWIKEFLPTKLTAQEFASRISRSGPTIERIEERGDEWDNVVLGRVMQIKPHPNADKLRIALTDVGREIVQIVCGGTNLRENMNVAVALPGAKVRWHGEGEPVVLETAKIRSEESHGMISAANEIGLFEYFPHAEREIMDLSDVAGAPGTPLAGALGLKDTIFDIEVTSNRADAFSVAGFAREASAILQIPLRVSRGGTKQSQNAMGLLRCPVRGTPRNGRGLHVRIQSKRCRRYTGALIRGVKVGPSPFSLRKRLIDAGVRPIHNLVDITNYVMMETGQPMHVFDVGKLEVRSGKLEVRVRQARAGERVKALDGKDYQLDSSMLVIADAARPIAIAGVMGGEESGVTEKTTDVIFECASFDPLSVRKTARALNLHSESSQRFEKNLSPEGVPHAMTRALELAQELAGGSLVSVADAYLVRPQKITVPFRASEVSVVVGTEIAASRQKSILKSLGFAVLGAGDKLRAVVPWWRSSDIEGEHDIVEEVSRLYGYHHLPSVIPSGVIPSRARDPELSLEDAIKQFFLGAGWTEAMTYAFVNERTARYDGGGGHLRLANPLTDEWTHLRQGIIPSLLRVVLKNQGEFPAGMVFEVARAYLPRLGELPDEELRLAGVLWGSEADSTQFFQVKGALESLFAHLGVSFHFDRPITWTTVQVTDQHQSVIQSVSDSPAGKQGDLARSTELLHPGRSLALVVNEQPIGALGELHPQVADDFGLKNCAVIFEIRIAPLARAHKPHKFVPIPAFPAVKRDISIVVDDLITHDAIRSALLVIDPLVAKVELFDVYAGKGIPTGKRSLSFHLTYQSPDRTLQGDEADRVHESVVRMLKEKFGTEVRN